MTSFSKKTAFAKLSLLLVPSLLLLSSRLQAEPSSDYQGDAAGLAAAGDLTGSEGGERDPAGAGAEIFDGEGEGSVAEGQSIYGGPGYDGQAGVDGANEGAVFTEATSGENGREGGNGVELWGPDLTGPKITNFGFVNGGWGGTGGWGGGGADGDTIFGTGGRGGDGGDGGEGGMGFFGARFDLTNESFINGGSGGLGGFGAPGGFGFSGAGGDGGNPGEGGHGGAGVAGQFFSFTNNGFVYGGSGADGGVGGRGGDGGDGPGGIGGGKRSGEFFFPEIEGPGFYDDLPGGGNGGVGVDAYYSSVYNYGTIQGGFGGSSGLTGENGSPDLSEPLSLEGPSLGGGHGGAGILGTTSFIVNRGDIIGGDAGSGDISGFGGIGVMGSSLTLINSGYISGGSGEFGQSPAIIFDYGINSLAIEKGSVINGDVIGSGSDLLIIGGKESHEFDVSGIADGRVHPPMPGDFRDPREEFLIIDEPSFEFEPEFQYYGFNEVSIETEGVVTLTGKSFYSQETLVNTGIANVAGDLSSTSMFVGENGTVSGIGSTGNLTLSGGRHAPGNSIGTQTVNGDYRIDGGILEIELTPGVASDKVVVNGAVAIDSGTLRVLGIDEVGGVARANHVIIENDGIDAVSGVFSAVDNQLAFYDIATQYEGGDGNDVALELTRNAVTPEEVASRGLQGNQASQQTGIARLVFSNGSEDGKTIQSAILGGTEGGAQRAFEQLSGDVYAAGPNAQRLVQNGISAPISNRMQGRGASSGSLASFFTGQEVQVGAFVPDEEPDTTDGSKVWVEGLGGRGTIDGGVGIAESNYDYRGLVTGYEFPTNEAFIFGLYFSYADVDLIQDDRAASILSENFGAGLYSGYRFGEGWRMSMQLGANWNNNTAARRLNFGNIDRQAQAEYDDFYLNASLEVAKTFTRGESGYIEPFVGVTGRREQEGGFFETGAGAANLFRGSDTEYVGETLLGVRFGYELDTDGAFRIQPRAQLGWQHHLGENENTFDANFIGLPGNGAVAVNGAPTAENALVGTLGVNLLSEGGASLYADYGFGYSDVHEEHSIRGGVSLPW